MLWEDVYGNDVKKVESRIVGVKTPAEISDLKKTLTEFYKQTEATFAIYGKQNSYPTNQLDLIKPVGAFSKTEFGLFKSVPWYNYDRGLSEILAGAEALGLGNGWGWDFLIPATSDFVGIVQLYLIIMTVLITVSVMVTFLFKFSATDRLDQVNQLFHRFATTIVRIPEYGVSTTRGGKKTETVLLYDTVENRPDWEVDLDNLQNYQVVPTRKRTGGKFIIMRYLTLREFLFENRAEWSKNSEFYDSLRFGRAGRKYGRDKKSIRLPIFLERAPTASRSGLETTERGLRFLLKKLREETIFGILLFTVPKNILIAILRRLNNKQVNAVAFVVYRKINAVFSDIGDILVCGFRRFSRWDYRSYLRFEEKFHYGNQFYKNLTLKNPEPTVSNADLNRIMKGETLDVRTFTVGAYSNLDKNRIEPPIDDFIYLSNKYFSWAIRPVRKGVSEIYRLKAEHVDARISSAVQHVFSKLTWLPALGLGVGYRKFKTSLSMVISDIDYLVRRFNPNVTRAASVEVELNTVSQEITFDKKELNKDFWNNYLISTEKLYRKARPARRAINVLVSRVAIPVVDLFYISAKRLVRYNNKVDAVRETLPLFKFLTAQSVNKFWVYHSAIEFA